MPISADGDRQPRAVDGDQLVALPPAGAPAEAFTVQVKRVVAPIRQQVLDQLREAIVTHRLRPGQRLIERELMEQAGVSRPTIREALRQLAAEGLVASIPNKGTVVASMSRDEVRELYDLRVVLENMAVRQFHEHATEEERARLRDAFRALEETVRTDPERPLLPLKEEFYEALLAGARNSLLGEILGGLQNRVRALRATSLAQPGRPREMVEEVRAVVDALEAGDADAAAAATEHHIRRAAETLFDAIGSTTTNTEGR